MPASDKKSVKPKSKVSQQKKQNLKKNRADPPSDDEDEIWDTEDEEDEDEDEDDDEEEETDSSYRPPKKRPSNRRRVIESDEEDEDLIDEDDDEELDPREFRKKLAQLFPSKYMNKKTKADEKKKKSTKYANGKKLRNRVVDLADDEDDDYYEDEDDEEDEDGEEGKFSLVLSYGGNPMDEQDEAAIEDDSNEECDSDDEERFMKENYQKIELPEEEPTSPSKKDVKSRIGKKEKKNSTKDKEQEAEADEDSKNVEAEYVELVELKKHLTEKLKKSPKSKFINRAIEDCRVSIKELVQKSRLKNARKYHKMVNSSNDQTSEIEYFKKKLSNKEQLRIMNELQDINDHIRVEKPYRLTLLESNMPAKYKATVMQKVNLLRSMEPGDSEYHKVKYWVDAFMRVPFSIYKGLDIKMSDGIEKCTQFMEKSKNILDNCVYGLDDAKMQIMQMVGQWIANPGAMGTAIAINGPMGTGKTTLIKEGVSKLLGREFAFIALGGTGDASFLEGHSYTYEGSTWGKIVQILMDSKCMNPVIYFDELDKVSETARGEEIIGILTHLTDTTQNSQFHDKYFSEIDFDLSKCLFIFSYNDENKVNSILKDRMYRIQTKGYDAKEKVIIARDHLLPKIREQVSFNEDEVVITDETLQYIIGNKALTGSEAGVRNLKRCLEIIHTKLNLYRLMTPGSKLFGKEMEMEVSFPFTVTKDAVDFLIKNEEKQNQSLLAMYV
jgi:ATP-dependent Lon protease